MKLFDRTLTQLERALDVRLVRHGALAGNVANADTPGYRPRDVDFKAAMGAMGSVGGVVGGTSEAAPLSPMAALGSAPSLMQPAAPGTPAPAVPGAAGSIQAQEISGTSPTQDGNTVDLDRTMAALSENAMQYGAASRAAQRKLAILRYAASDGAA
jgi:flagellar basal-body rod protein FlgB